MASYRLQYYEEAITSLNESRRRAKTIEQYKALSRSIRGLLVYLSRTEIDLLDHLTPSIRLVIPCSVLEFGNCICKGDPDVHLILGYQIYDDDDVDR